MSFTGKSENLAETAILKDFFHFCSKWSPFSKMLILKEILSFLKEVSSVFEKCQFLVALVSFRKKQHFMQKASVLGQMSEFPSTVIK